MGYGVFQVSPDECERCVTEALEVGYRMIDTAQAYQNEEGVGRAWKKSGVRREDLFLVSKIWFTNYGYERVKASIDESLRKMQTDYLVITGENAWSRQASTEVFDAVPHSNKEMHVIPEASHFDMYDLAPFVSEAFEFIVPFFAQYL